VSENAKDILAGSRTTFAEAANLAVNQTLMRSINTSLIALLPVAGLLFVGAGVLGVGTIKDLALILFVGLASGAYSSLFLATPIVVDLTERDPQYKALTKRVVAKRSSEAKRAADAALTGAAVAPRRSSGPAPAPKVGARPERRKRK
jgi:preprotein translocase subunit SecF